MEDNNNVKIVWLLTPEMNRYIIDLIRTRPMNEVEQLYIELNTQNKSQQKIADIVKNAKIKDIDIIEE